MARLIDVIPMNGCTLIYGTGGTGKTTIGLEASVAKAISGKTVVYTFSAPYSFISRGIEIARGFGENEIPKNVIFIKAETLDELREVAMLFLSKPPDYFVVDTVTSGYRASISLGKRGMETGRVLTEIIGLMISSSPSDGAILIADAQTKPTGEERPSAEASLKFWCDNRVHVMKLPDGTRKATLSDKEVYFKITSTGTEVV